MTQSTGASNQVKIIAAAAVVVIGGIALAAILLNNGGDDSAETDNFSSGSTVEYGDVTVIGDPLPVYQADGEDPAVGMTAPEIEGFSVTGAPVEIIPNGRAKMIVLLAHWCPHCQAEVPRVQEWLDEGNLPEGVEVWGVATNTNKGQPNFPPSSWLEREGWTPQLLMDDESFTAATAYGLSGFPFWVVVDADGTVVARSSGQTSIEQVEEWANQIAISS